jgi:hypothetical protein
VWACDITYLATREGWLYLAVVLDLFARRVLAGQCSQPSNVSLLRVNIAIEHEAITTSYCQQTKPLV